MEMEIRASPPGQRNAGGIGQTPLDQLACIYNPCIGKRTQRQA